MSSASSSSDWQPPAPEQLDEWLDRYTVRRLIGRGGMGAVYLAWQGALDRNVAVKLLPAELGTDTGFVKRFEREAKAMARLDHPNIVRVFDFGRTAAGHFYFVMEYVDGCDVAQVIRRGEVPVAEAMEIVSQLCAALGYAHEEGIIHRDIKPSNILLDQKGRVKIADFGLARPATPTPDPGLTRMTESGMVMGTLEYMAPEQLMGKDVDHRADLYAVGVLFYELLTGDVPRGAWRPPSNCRPMDRGLDQVVQRALQPKPEERYQRADEVQRDLTTVLQRKVPPVHQSWQGKRAGLIVAILAAAGGGAWWWVQSPPPMTAGATPRMPEVGSEAPAAATPVPLPPVPAAPAPVDPAPSPVPENKPAVSKIKATAAVVNPSPITKTAGNHQDGAAADEPDKTASPPMDMPPLPVGSLALLDFAQAPEGEGGGVWNTGNAKVETGSLLLTTPEAAAGALTWTLPGGPVDLSGQLQKHWQIDAQLTAAASRAFLLTLEDGAGRTRSWRVKGESFFQDRPRQHAHRLSLAEAEVKSLTAGFGPRFETPGFNAGQILKVRLEADPAGDPVVPLAWRIYRIWLMPDR